MIQVCHISFKMILMTFCTCLKIIILSNKSINIIYFYFQLVFRQNQTNRSRKEASDATKRTRSLFDQRFGIQTKRLLTLRQRRRHSQTLSDSPIGRRRIFHRSQNHVSHFARVGRTLQSNCGWTLC